MGKSICLTSGKDGTGKSTIAVNLGVALSNMGLHTIIVDGDIKGASVGLLLGFVNQDLPTIQDYLTDGTTLEEAVVNAFGTDILLGGLKINKLMGVSIEKFPVLLEGLSEGYDLLVVDSPGGLANDTLMVIASCEAIIIVLTPDINSVIHAIKSIVLANKVGTRVIGAIINRGGSPYDIPADQVSDFLKIDVLGVIKEDDKVKKAVNEAAPVLLGYPNSDFSLAIKDIVRNLLEKGLLD